MDNEHIPAETHDPPKRRGGSSTFSALMMLFCLVGGAVAPLFGLVLIIIHGALTGDTLFGRIGTLLVVVSIPLLLAGSHLMDEASR